MKYIFSYLFFLFTINVSAQIDGITRVRMDTTMAFSGLEILDSVVQDKRIVLTGENHQFNVTNNVLKFNLILYLYEKGFRYFVLEFGQGIGYLANQYVTEGDEEAIDILDAGTPDYVPNYLSDLLFPLREFNKDKAPEDQVKIVGADLTRYPIYSLRAMARIIQQSNCEKDLALFYEDINVVASARPTNDRLGFTGRIQNLEDFDIKAGFKSYQNRLFELSVRNLISDFYKDTIRFERALGHDYADFKFLLDELKTTVEWYKRDNVVIQSHVDRERHLEKRILGIFENDSMAKVAGQFGRCHVRLSDFDQDCYAFDMISVTERLQKHELLEDKLFILPIFYTFLKSEVHFEKSATTYSQKELIHNDAVFLYDTEKEWFTFDGEVEVPRYVLINTFTPYAETDHMLPAQESSTAYRGVAEEGHTTFLVQPRYFDVSVNDDFGVELLQTQQLFYGFNFTTVFAQGGRYGLGASFMPPRTVNNDSVAWRYTNWNIPVTLGYTWLYRSWISLYSNVMTDIGFAKVREDRGLLNSGFTYDFEKNRAIYRNPYFTFNGIAGIQFKFKSVSIFSEVGYGFDVTHAKWRNKGILPNSTGQKFDQLFYRFGLSFYYRDRVGSRF
ncbi:MAG: erythromycin esterase family protein [Crocinitomicaceae bacterium]|nr:erythromycin esterase family protein [Crocinitomicaceae bacterium]